MTAILKHELKSYFHSLTAYVFGAFLLVMVGFGSVYYNLMAAVSNFEYVLSFGSIIFVIIVPHAHHAGHRRGTPPENRSAALLPAGDHHPGGTGQVSGSAGSVSGAAGDYLHLSAHLLPLWRSLSAHLLWLTLCHLCHGRRSHRCGSLSLLPHRKSGHGCRYQLWQ